MPETEADSPLAPAQVPDLLMIAHIYHEQAHFCITINAPLASCVMLGATVEAMLTTIACIFSEKRFKPEKHQDIARANAKTKLGNYSIDRSLVSVLLSPSGDWEQDLREVEGARE